MYTQFIISLCGLATIIAPTYALFRLMISFNSSYDQFKNRTLSMIAIESGNAEVLKQALYSNGLFGSVMLFLYVYLMTTSFPKAIVLTLPLLVSFLLSAYSLQDNKKSLKMHMNASLLMFTYLILLKFIIGIMFDVPESIIFGLLDFLIIGISILFHRGMVNSWTEIFFSINLSLWVLLVFVI